MLGALGTLSDPIPKKLKNPFLGGFAGWAKLGEGTAARSVWQGWPSVNRPEPGDSLAPIHAPALGLI